MSVSLRPRVLAHLDYTQSYFLDKVLRRHISVQEEAARLKTSLTYPYRAKQGKFAYLVARGLRAAASWNLARPLRHLDIYLAAALRDNGGGTVIPGPRSSYEGPAARAQSGMRRVGRVTRRFVRGDASRNATNPGGQWDMVLLDGFRNYTVRSLQAPDASPASRGSRAWRQHLHFRHCSGAYVAYVATWPAGSRHDPCSLVMERNTRWKL